MICRVRICGAEDNLFTEDYLDGPQWTEWSTELPPQDALETKQKTQWHARLHEKDGPDYRGYEDPPGDEELQSWARMEQETRHRLHYYAISDTPRIRRDASEKLGEFETTDQFTESGINEKRVRYTFEKNEETGLWIVYKHFYWTVTDIDYYTYWTDWSDQEPDPYDVAFHSFGSLNSESVTTYSVRTESRTLYRYRRR